MTEPAPLSFSLDWGGWTQPFDGAPIVEVVLAGFVGRCQSCGAAAEEQLEGSVLVDPLVVDGTVYGDTYCRGCHADDLDGCFLLPPLATWDDETSPSEDE